MPSIMTGAADLARRRGWPCPVARSSRRRRPKKRPRQRPRAPSIPNAKVEAIWQPKQCPIFEKRAGDLKDVMQLAASEPRRRRRRNTAIHAKQSTSPWTYAVKITGKVVAADTASRAATLDVDADGDGKADAKVQIGPAHPGHGAARHAWSSSISTNSRTRSSGRNSARPSTRRPIRLSLDNLPREGLDRQDGDRDRRFSAAVERPAAARDPFGN